MFVGDTLNSSSVWCQCGERVLSKNDWWKSHHDPRQWKKAFHEDEIFGLEKFEQWKRLYRDGWEHKKWLYLERRSTTTKIIVFPPDLGSPSMKSIEISVHIRVGMGKGSINPGRGVVSPLLRWQVSHSATIYWIVLFIPCQKKLHRARSYVLRKPECPADEEAWSS